MEHASPDDGASRDRVPKKSIQRARRTAAHISSKDAGHLRPRQRRRASDRRSSRSGLRYNLCATSSRKFTRRRRSPRPAIGYDLRLHLFDRPRRNQHDHGRGAGNRQPTACAASARRYFARRNVAPVLQQIESPTTQDIGVNDCFKPVSRYWDRIYRPEQIDHRTARSNACTDFARRFRRRHPGPAAGCADGGLRLSRKNCSANAYGSIRRGQPDQVSFCAGGRGDPRRRASR